MNQACKVIYKILRLLTSASFFLTTLAYADVYADVNLLVRSNKFTEALAQIDAYLVTKPADPQIRFLKGVIQRNLGKLPEAIATFTKLTEEYPELPEPYNNLAVLYAGQGLYDKARTALEMAIRTNPSYATAHENLGDIYARLASQAYNKALQLDAGNAAVPTKLALIGDVFKPNLSNPRPVNNAPVVAAVVTPPTEKPAVTAEVKPHLPDASATVSSASKPVTAASVNSNVSKEVEVAVLAWAKAWSDKNIKTYLKAYSPQFSPASQQTRSAWEKDRHDRISGKASINVKLSQLNVTLNGNKATVTFRQAYKADALSVSSHKILDLQKVGEQWLITRESTGK